jgi:hypothetical protein
MDKKVIEGVTYVPLADIENSFKERIRKLSADRVAAEDRAKELQAELDSVSGKLGTIDTMAQSLEEYKTKLQEAESRYTRHTAMADHGWTDPDIRDAVEWAYSRAMQGKSKKEQMPLGEWLADMEKNPSTAPAVLKPHLDARRTTTEQTTEPTTEPAPVATEQGQIDPPALIPPRANNGVQPTPVQSTDLVDKGLQDLEFYRANRDAILKAYKGR